MILIKKSDINIKKLENFIIENTQEPIFKFVNESINYDINITSFITKQTEILWTVDEIYYDKDDIENFKNLPIKYQTLIKSIILYFLFAEKLVISNLDDLKKDTPYESAKNFYILQEYVESIHDRTYFKSGRLYYNDDHIFLLDKKLMNDIIETANIYYNEVFDINNYINDYYYSKTIDEKKIFQAVTLKLNLMNKWKNVNSYLYKLIAFFTIESVSFNCLFVLINLFKNNNKSLKYLIEINEFVARDEYIHSIFGIYLYKNYILNPLSSEIVTNIIKDITETEIEFLKIIMDEDFNLNDFNRNHFIEYIQHTANIILKLLDIPPLYDIKNSIPNEFNLQALKIKTNFFERIGLYINNYKHIKSNDILNMYDD